MPRRTPSRRPRHAVAAVVATALAAVVAVSPAGAAVARNVLRAWADVVGTDRPQPVASDEVIVVLRPPSAALRVRPGASSAAAVRAARSAQAAALGRLGRAGLLLEVRARYVKVVDAVVARVRYDRRAALAAARDVAGVYPLRALVAAGVTESALGALGDGARPSRVALPGDGAGITVALLDGPVDTGHVYLGGRVTALPGAGPVTPAAAAHGTAIAGIVVGDGGPQGLRGVAPKARVLAIPVLAQRADGGLQGSTADLLAGLEQAADPNGDDDLSDRARVVLAPLAAPYAGFADSPEARAIDGISRLGAIVVAAAGDDGPTGTSTGTTASPAAAPDALAVGATDGRERLPVVPLTVHGAVETSAQALALGGALAPQAGAPLSLHAIAAATGHAAGSAVADYGKGADRGVAVLVARDGGDLAAKARAAAAAGVRALLVYGADALPAGALGIDDRVPIPIVDVGAALGRELAHALESRAQVQVTFGEARYTPNAGRGEVAAFSSTGPLYAGGLKPDVVEPGVAIVSSLPGGAYGAITGASAAAAQAAGAAALVAAVHPDWTSARLRSALVSTAGIRAAGGSLAAVTAQGGGRVDAAAAAGARLTTVPATLALGTLAAGRDATGMLVIRNPGPRAASVALGFERDGSAPGSTVGLRADHPTFVLEPGAAVDLHVALQAAPLPAAGTAAGGWLVLTVDGGAVQRVPLVAVVAAPPLVPLRAATLDRRVLARSGHGATLTLLLGRVVRGDAGTLRIDAVRTVRIDLVQGTRRLGTLYAARDVLPGRYRFTVAPRGPGGDLLAPGAYRLAVAVVGQDGRQVRRVLAVSVR
jgi:hypothetical protein